MAGSPGIERVDRLEPVVDPGAQLLGGRRVDLGERHAARHGLVDEKLALAAGIMDRGEPAGRDLAVMAEQQQSVG